MRKTFYIVFVTIGFQSFFIQKIDKGEIMHIKLNKTSYFLGEPMPVHVSFKNSLKNNMVLENPSKSPDVTMHLVDFSDQHDYFYSMKKIDVFIIDRKTDQYVTMDSPKEQISIAPSSSFDFVTDVN